MNPLIQLKMITLPLLLPLALGCFGLSPKARAVLPAPDGGYPGFNTAEGTKALFSRTTGAWNIALGGQAVFHDTTGNSNTAVGLNALFLKQKPCAPPGFKPFTNQNLLQNFSFNTVGPNGISTTFSGPLPNPPPSSAAKFWTVHNSNSGAVITTQMIPSTGPMGPRMLRIRTGGNEGGVIQHFAPPNAGPLKAIASAWVYVIKGQVQLVTGGKGFYSGNTFNTATNKWELLQVCVDGKKPTNWIGILNQDVNGGAFLVDAASVVKVP